MVLPVDMTCYYRFYYLIYEDREDQEDNSCGKWEEGWRSKSFSLEKLGNNSHCYCYSDYLFF